MDLAEMRDAYIDDGYGYEAASTRACQDAFLAVVASSEFADESMRERDWADVHARLERVFSDRRYARQLSRAKDNWLELPAGKVTAGVLSEVKRLAARS